MTLQLGWFSTGRGEGSRALLWFIRERIQSGELDAQIQFVFSNREPGEAEGSDAFFEVVHSYGLTLVTHSSRKFRERVGGNFTLWREEYDGEVLERLEGFSPALCVLAGYMLIVSPLLCTTYTMVNLHPALPSGPVGTWQEVLWQLIERRSPETGAMMHLVTQEVDRGPVISYFTLSLRGPLFDPHWEALGTRSVQEIQEREGEEYVLFQRIRQEGHKREPYLLLETLKLLADTSIRVEQGHLLTRERRPWEGVCLNEAIEGALR